MFAAHLGWSFLAALDLAAQVKLELPRERARRFGRHTRLRLGSVPAGVDSTEWHGQRGSLQGEGGISGSHPYFLLYSLHQPHTFGIISTTASRLALKVVYRKKIVWFMSVKNVELPYRQEFWPVQSVVRRLMKPFLKMQKYQSEAGNREPMWLVPLSHPDNKCPRLLLQRPL